MREVSFPELVLSFALRTVTTIGKWAGAFWLLEATGFTGVTWSIAIATCTMAVYLGTWGETNEYEASPLVLATVSLVKALAMFAIAALILWMCGWPDLAAFLAAQ